MPGTISNFVLAWLLVSIKEFPSIARSQEMEYHENQRRIEFELRLLMQKDGKLGIFIKIEI